MTTKLQELSDRLDEIEDTRNQEVLILVEILSNASFFGDLKKSHCMHAENGQCSYFVLSEEAKKKIPIAAVCRIKNCEKNGRHWHIELSSISCVFCQKLSLSRKMMKNV